MAKISDGGWIPLTLGLALFFLMTTWKSGQTHLREILTGDAFSLKLFAESIANDNVVTVPGTAVFLTAPGSRSPCLAA